MPVVKLVALLPVAVLAACATTDGDTDMPDDVIEVAPAGDCDAAPIQHLIGERATGDLGASVLAETRSEKLRWIPPRTAVTQDFRPDRVNVVYDDDYIIERIYCG